MSDIFQSNCSLGDDFDGDIECKFARFTTDGDAICRAFSISQKT